MPDAPTDPDGKEVFDALVGQGVDPETAYDAVRGERNMASENLIVGIEPQMTSLRWMFGAMLAILTSAKVMSVVFALTH